LKWRLYPKVEALARCPELAQRRRRMKQIKITPNQMVVTVYAGESVSVYCNRSGQFQVYTTTEEGRTLWASRREAREMARAILAEPRRRPSLRSEGKK
jgi:hypothetical protein